MASAELASWYRSYAPLMGQMALPLWSPLRLMSGHALTSSSSSAHTGLNTERDQHDERDNKPVRSAESGRGEVGERDLTKENEVNTSLHQPVMVATDGIGNHCGRRVSMKPEQYYFLQNPDISHSALCRLFPGVSAQRYARWRRKVNILNVNCCFSFIFAIDLLRKKMCCFTIELCSWYFGIKKLE